MERYLLFDSGCCTCTSIASTIQSEAEEWLTCRSLRDPEMQVLLHSKVPNWQWEPMLIEVRGTRVHAFTGLAMSTRLGIGLGPRRSINILRLINRNVATDPQRRGILKFSGLLLAGAVSLGLPKSWIARGSASAQASDFNKHHDPDFGFSFEYPYAWQLTIGWKQSIPYPQPDAALKRITLLSANGLVDVDVWTLQGQDFPSWLQHYVQTRNVPQILHGSRGKVAGRDAWFYDMRGRGNDLHAVFFGDENYAYRIWNMVRGGVPAQSGYRHILNTFAVAGETSQAADIPADQSIALGRDANPALMDQPDPTCCQYTCSTNQFACCVKCDPNCHDTGNCTWWVYYKYCSGGGVPYRGDAYLWWGQRYDYPGWEAGSTPAQLRPSIAWWDQSGDTGHVAYIANYYSGDTVTISEMGCNVDYTCNRSRSISIYNPGGYLYKCSGPCWT